MTLQVCIATYLRWQREFQAVLTWASISSPSSSQALNTWEIMGGQGGVGSAGAQE